jgi:hypothetical protein
MVVFYKSWDIPEGRSLQYFADTITDGCSELRLLKMIFKFSNV